MAASSPLRPGIRGASPAFHPRWFYRRPLFWLALAAGLAVVLAEEREPASWFWAALLGVGAGLALLRQRELSLGGAVLAVAALFGLRATLAIHPAATPSLPAHGLVTLRGVLEGTPGQVAGKRAVLATTGLYARSGWAPQAGKVGLLAPEGAEVGDELQVTGRLTEPPPTTGPGALSERLGWLRLGTRRVLRYRPEAVRRVARHPLPAWRLTALRLRERILTANRRTLSPSAATLVNDFLIGDSAPPDPELAEQVANTFRSSGLIHLLVVSGSQVTLVLGLFLWLGGRVRPLRFLFWALGGAAVGGYYLLTDGAAPVARAVVMGLALLGGLVLERETDGENSLGLAALALLAVDPLGLFDLGFQLSFAALWGLVRLAPPLHAALAPPARSTTLPRIWVRGWNCLAVAVSASLAAHLAVAPLLAWHFQTSTWSGILANLPMLALAAPFLFLGVAHTALAACGLHGVAPLVELATQGMLGGAEFFARPPFGTGGVFPPPVWLLPPLLAGVAAPSWVKRSRLPVLSLTGFLAAALFLSERLPARPPSVPTLRVLDIGQGDAVLLQSPGGGTVLVDGGPPRLGGGAQPVVRALRALRIPALDVVVATHPHADHVGGLAQVLSEFPVGLLLYDGDSPANSEVWRAVLAAAASRRVPMLAPPPGHRLQVRDAILTVLGPPAAPVATQPLPKGENERSLVLRWDCGGMRVLLPGDAEAGEEEQLLAWGGELQADVLKVGHHGSDSSSMDAWLAAVRPRLGIISCGRGNRFGHPGHAALDRLHAAGVTLGRTDQEGTVTVEARQTGLVMTPWFAAVE